MSKLQDILVDRMIGDMSKILTFNNVFKSPEELYSLSMPKLEAARVDLKELMLEIIGKDESVEGYALHNGEGMARTDRNALRAELRQKVEKL